MVLKALFQPSSAELQIEHMSSAAYVYRMSGLVVASDIPLPIRTPLPHSEAHSADVTMSLAPVPACLSHPMRRGPNWSADARRLLLDLEGIGRFLAVDGCRITYEPARGIPVEDILIFATGTALAAVLYQRGAFLLHGAAVTYRGRGFVFCGASGAGKSTLAAALCRAGCDFAVDDLCAVESSPTGVPLIHPDGRVLRLYPDSIEHIGLTGAVGGRVRMHVEKYHVTPPETATTVGAGTPLGAIYMLADTNAVYPPGIAQLAPLAAAQALLRHSYRRQLALVYAQQGLPAARTAALLSHIGVYRLSRPRDFSRLGDAVAQLRDHWDAIL